MSSILAAELAKAKAKLEHEKVHGREKRKTEKHSTENMTRNPGIEKRMSRDDKYHVSKTSAQKMGYDNMQSKAELYRQFHQGEIDRLEGGVMERRTSDDSDTGSRDSDDSEYDSSADSSEVEIVDEFGRTRMVPKRKRYLFEARKEVSRDGYESRDTFQQTAREMVEKPANIIYGDVVQTDSFARNDFVPQENETSTSHYDSTKEIRNRGVGFMQFSQDAEVRERQQKELKEARAVTQAFVEEKKKDKEKGRDEISELDRFRQRYEARERRVKEVYQGGQ